MSPIETTLASGSASDLRALVVSLSKENDRLRAALPKRPEKGTLAVDIFYSHGDWKEPHRFGHGYALRADIMALKRDMLREFSSTVAEDFHEHLSSAFFLVGDAEQRRREIKWQADIGVPFPEREIVSVGANK